MFIIKYSAASYPINSHAISRVKWTRCLASPKLGAINIVSPSRLNSKLLWYRIHFLSELYERSRFTNGSESLLEILADKSRKEIRTLLTTMMNFLAEIPCKSTCNAKTSWWQVINSKQAKRLHCGNALLCSNLFSTLLAFLANVLIFFKCLKVNESHILFSHAPRCEYLRVRGEWKKENFIMNFTLSWETLESSPVFCCCKY